MCDSTCPYMRGMKKTVRLYDGLENKDGNLKRAKNQFTGVGEALIGIDTSEDGNWIVGELAIRRVHS